MKTKIFAIFMAVGIALLSVSNAFAMSYPSTLPPLPLENSTDYDWYVMQYDNQIKLVAIDKKDYEKLHFAYSPNWFGSGQGAYIMMIDPYEQATWQMWVLGGEEWGSQGELIAPSQTATFSGEPLYSTRDIYNKDTNELVFPLTLPQQIQIVTGETLETVTMPKLGTTVSQLVVCGVGCLALLISLPLLGILLKKFL